jgi:glutamine synthetase
MFDDVRFTPTRTTPASSWIQLELPSNMGSEYETGNMGHRPRVKGGYFPVPPVDSAQDIRSEMLSVHERNGR